MAVAQLKSVPVEDLAQRVGFRKCRSISWRKHLPTFVSTL